MELALVISIVSLSGFAAALSYNVYEFKKVGRTLDGGFRALREEHREMIRALEGINESLAIFVKRFGSKHRRAPGTKRGARRTPNPL